MTASRREGDGTRPVASPGHVAARGGSREILCMSYYVCVYIYIYIYIYTHTHVYIYIYIVVLNTLIMKLC